MKINIKPFDLTRDTADLVIIPIFEDDTQDEADLVSIAEAFPIIAKEILANADAYGNAFSTHFLHVNDLKGKRSAKLLFVGAGRKADADIANTFQVAAAALRSLNKIHFASAVLVVRGNSQDAAEKLEATVQGAAAGAFRIDTYKTGPTKLRGIDQVSFVRPEALSTKIFSAAANKGKVLAESLAFARRLCNEPPNVMTPSRMADEAKQMAKEFGLQIEIMDEPKLKKLGMNLLLSVGNGSEQPTRMMVLRYEPAKKAKAKKGLLALVGKAITFDTGGISLKPGEGMDLMKFDMAGGAAVLGAMRAIAILKPEQPVMAIVAAAENMPSGKATKPSDIIKSYSGKTVEILNTDAEGRLVLGDAIAYARKLGAKRIVDVATLTGAVIIALGEHNAGIFGNDQEFIDQIIECGKRGGEDLWQLPLGRKYSNHIKSSVADIKNIGGKKGASITAAAFLQEFTGGTTWAHLDIAGTAWLEAATPYMPCGPTGFGVRTLFNLAEDPK